MKVIPKKLQGGSFSSLFVDYSPVLRRLLLATQLPTQSSSEKKDTGKLTEKDLFEMVSKIDGLPNEMRQITDDLIATFLRASITGQSTSSLATLYLSNLYLIKVAALNKTNFENAFKNAQTNGALAEPAITLDGKLVVLDSDGKVSKVTLSTYMDNPDQYYALSVSLLANLRKYDPSMILNQGAIDIINNGIGFEGFQTLISKALKNLGTDEYSTLGIVNTNAAQLGLALISRLREDDRVQAMNSITADGLYKYKIIDKTLKNQIDALTKYLAATLPDRAKTWAAYKMGTSDKTKATTALIQLLLLLSASDSHSFSIDYTAPKENKSGSGSSENPMNDIPSTMASNFVNGYGPRLQILLNPGSSYLKIAMVTTLPLTDNTDKLLPAGTLTTVRNGGYSGSLDWNNVTVGGVNVPTTAFDGIYIGDPKISSIDYPIDIEYYQATNKIRPDFSEETILKKEAADSELQKMGIQVYNKQSAKANYLKINEVYKKHGLPPAYDLDGDTLTRWCRFGVMNGVVNDNILGDNILDDNDLVKPLDIPEELLNHILEIMGDETFSDGWGTDFLFEGTIWIPVIENNTAALTGKSLTQGELYLIDREKLLIDKDTWKSGRKSQQ